MKQIKVQVTVNAELRDRLTQLAQSEGLSVSSYARVVLNRHILSIDRAIAQSPPSRSLQDFYQNL